MTGAEVLVTLVGILAGFATCLQYATQVYEKIKRKRELASAAASAELLASSLSLGWSAIENELNTLWRLNGAIGLGHGMCLSGCCAWRVAHSI